MKNIHIIPTDEPKFDKYLVLNKESKLCIWDTNVMGSQTTLLALNIYITSNEEIKEGDWVLNIEENTIFKPTDAEVYDIKNSEAKYYEYCKKIILTTDFKLAPDVQKIDDEFLEWFVKNPSCEEVETERLEDGQYVDRFADGSVVEGIYENYKIIIPTEEPKQTVQEYEEQGLEKYSYELVEPKQETIEKEMIENMVELLKEDIECVHMYLDDKQVPRQNDNGSKYSIIGRIKKLEASFQKQLSELENYYLTKSK